MHHNIIVSALDRIISDSEKHVSDGACTLP
jgi:hypothetical protein